jgi:Beta-glucosidase/6-phospho-beta-glucosidase/beta-galactosidase
MRISTTRIARPIEVWGGLECTINRVRDRWHDQFELGPLAARVDTIDLVAGLGISALRYPLVWERVAPGNLGDIDWTWSDARMERMREVGIAPIAGLVHHGSGPRHTSLLDPLFPEKLALYARAVAERYPDLRYVTPVNEPLTTARFSGLYGHWYPHHRSKRSFAVALLRQCAAVRAAIRAMREVIPDLELIQTEDLGRVSSTPELKYQADFENERRWLTLRPPHRSSR